MEKLMVELDVAEVEDLANALNHSTVNAPERDRCKKILDRLRTELCRIAFRNSRYNDVPLKDLYKESIVLWTEDDATTNDPDHEGVDKALERIFNSTRLVKENAKAFEDTQDSCEYLYERGTILVIVSYSYPGNSSIRVHKKI